MALPPRNLTACLLAIWPAAWLLAAGHHAQDRAQPVALELVLAMDTSSSFDEAEFQFQKQGVAAAFRHPDVLAAIQSCGGEAIAVALVQWSGNRMHLVAVDWTLVRDQESAAQLAAKVAASPRLLTGFTGLGGAIRFFLQMIEENGLEGRRKIIDISGDGSSSGLRPGLERERAVKRGVTINGLAVLYEEPDLDRYYGAHVIGGSDAFVISVASLYDFAQAIRTKLEREIRCPRIAGSSLPDKA